MAGASARRVGETIQVGIDVLKTTVSPTTKRVLAQTGSVLGQTTDADNVEWWQHIGIVSLPSEAEPGRAAAQAVAIRQGGHDVIISTQDVRGLELAGQLKPGETCIYAAGKDGKAQGRILIKQDGSINLFTKEGNASGGKGIMFSINPSGAISIASSNGSAILLETDGTIRVFSAGGGGLTVKADGSVQIASGAKVEISGGSITLGGAAALPLAVGPQVVAAISALQIQLAAHATAWAALGALSGPVLGAMIAPIAAPIAGATATGAAAVGSASGLIPTKRVSGD